MSLNERIGSLANLGFELLEDTDARKYAIGKAYYENKWFTEDQVLKMIHTIADHYLNYDLLSEFTQQYRLADTPDKIKTIALIPAGNVPMVGFHDLMCILLSGHHAMVKLSDKDKVLIPYAMQLLESINLELVRSVTFVDKLQGFDAVIATGSNNTAKIFERYFAKYPTIIRSNRTGVAVLTGDESKDELEGLAEDIFSYYGLGCRNISKLYVPEAFEFDQINEILNSYKQIVLHPKYKNNFDYNLAIHMLNRTKYMNLGSLILVEDQSLHSRIASLHYERYNTTGSLVSSLQDMTDQIQCISSRLIFDKLPVVPLGDAQKPKLCDFADGIDTMAFLADL
ncbi:MAG: acyl-CoA reductase [Bacteroidia bacterium]|nr:acyl-CoA reductase [Bacteroidia bacterium]